MAAAPSMAPAGIRMKVWIASHAESIPGILSARNSTTSKIPVTPSTHVACSACSEGGRSSQPMRPNKPAMNSVMYSRMPLPQDSPPASAAAVSGSTMRIYLLRCFSAGAAAPHETARLGNRGRTRNQHEQTYCDQLDGNHEAPAEQVILMEKGKRAGQYQQRSGHDGRLGNAVQHQDRQSGACQAEDPDPVDFRQPMQAAQQPGRAQDDQQYRKRGILHWTPQGLNFWTA